MNPLNPSVFSMGATCLPCCTVSPPPPSLCACRYFHYNLTYEQAVDLVDNYTISCMMETPTPVLATRTIEVDGSDVVVHFQDTVAQELNFGFGVIAVSVKKDTVISFNLTAETNNSTGGALASYLVAVSSCTVPSGTPNYYEEDGEGSETSVTFMGNFTFPYDGVYYITFTAGDRGAGNASECDFNLTMTFDDAYVVLPVVYGWNVPMTPDTGPWFDLQSCPKLLLPILTEATGDWYASSGDAQAAIDDFTSNCVGYSASVLETFTATDGGSMLTLYGDTGTPTVTGVVEMYGSVNALEGETIDIDYVLTTTAGALDVTIDIYYQDGTLVETFSDIGGSGSGTFTSAPLTVTGKFIIRVNGGGDPDEQKTFTAEITSSGTLTVNPVQALYDVGLNCPQTLDCELP